MGMSEGERWALVCEPALKRIESGVSKLTEVVITGNGKPSLAAQVASLPLTSAKCTTPNQELRTQN
jgi:hypothetical protein